MGRDVGGAALRGSEGWSVPWVLRGDGLMLSGDAARSGQCGALRLHGVMSWQRLRRSILVAMGWDIPSWPSVAARATTADGAGIWHQSSGGPASQSEAPRRRPGGLDRKRAASGKPVG